MSSTKVVAAVQMVSTASVAENLATAARLIAEAAGQGAELVVLPEVFAVLEGDAAAAAANGQECNSPGSHMHANGEVEGDAAAPLQSFLAGQARQHGIYLVGGTIPLLSRPDMAATAPGRGAPGPDRTRDDPSQPGMATTAPGRLVDGGRVRAACLVYDRSGQQIARYDKMHLFDVKVNDQQAEYSESRSYEPGTSLSCVRTELGQLGLSICYDLRFPELYRQLRLAGAQLITVPAAFTRVTGAAHWEPLLRARAIENQCYLIAAAQGGRHNAQRETWGHSMLIDPWGTVLAELQTGEGVALATIDLPRLHEVRKKMPITEHIRLPGPEFNSNEVLTTAATARWHRLAPTSANRDP